MTWCHFCFRYHHTPTCPRKVADADQVVAEFKEWLNKPGNGDAPCTCGHEFRHHLADLSGCADCNDYEPVHLRCGGFNLDRSEL